MRRLGLTFGAADLKVSDSGEYVFLEVNPQGQFLYVEILTGLAIPLARVTIKRENERELRHAVWEMRDAIDRYKDAADRAAFQIKVGTEGYPPDLDLHTD